MDHAGWKRLRPLLLEIFQGSRDQFAQARLHRVRIRDDGARQIVPAAKAERIRPREREIPSRFVQRRECGACGGAVRCIRPAQRQSVQEGEKCRGPAIELGPQRSVLAAYR